MIWMMIFFSLVGRQLRVWKWCSSTAVFLLFDPKVNVRHVQLYLQYTHTLLKNVPDY